MFSKAAKSKDFPHDALWYAATATVTAAILAAIWVFSPEPAPLRPLDHTYYVWQKQWNDDVRGAVATADIQSDGFMVLVGEINAANAKLRLDPAYPDWGSLAACRAPVTIVLRANAALSSLLESDARNEAVAFVCNAFNRCVQDAKAKGVSISGLQLDYDCPSSKLSTYADFLETWRKTFGDYQLSITALPTWLKRREFSALVHKLEYYVLQVHSLDPPKSIADTVTLCDTSCIPSYLERAAAFDVTFYLALPTYGYRFAFDPEGRFSAIFAEGPKPTLKPGYSLRTVSTDPESIAGVVRTLNQRHPRTLRGIAWFRLPIASDTLNWSWSTLSAVRDGRSPVTSLHAEVRSPSPGLFEIWIVNRGETVSPHRAEVTVAFDPASVLAFDSHNGFEAKPVAEGHLLAGESPKPGESVMAAWYRAKDAQSKGPVAGEIELRP